MGKASRTKHETGHAQRIAAQRAAARRARLRNRLLLAGGAIVAVVAVTVAMVLVKTGTSHAPAPPPSDGPTGTALASTVRELTTVPASTLDTVGAGSIDTSYVGKTAITAGSGYLVPVNGTPLTAGGKPEVLYMGADFCPYCAALRWPLIVALSRFGSFSGLSAIRSAVTNGAGQAEPYPATPTWTFYGSSYSSPYLVFTAVELQTNVPDPANGTYTLLQTPTTAQLSTLPPYGPQDLQGLTWRQITAALRNTATAAGANIDASANYLTAAICELTGNRPATACTPAVQALQARLG